MEAVADGGLGDLRNKCLGVSQEKIVKDPAERELSLEVLGRHF
jgi:hypothetical protein